MQSRLNKARQHSLSACVPDCRIYATAHILFQARSPKRRAMTAHEPVTHQSTREKTRLSDLGRVCRLSTALGRRFPFEDIGRIGRIEQ